MNQSLQKKTLGRNLGILAAIVVFLVFPLVCKSEYVLRVVIMCFIYSLLASSLNLISGVTGQISMGHAGFYAIGAYTSALLAMRLGWPVWAGLIAAAVLSALAGLLIAWPAMRLSGGYLAIITLGFAEVIRLMIINFVGLTNGNMGLIGIVNPVFFGISIDTNKKYYYYAFIVVLLVLLLFANLIASKFGRNLKAIKYDEIAAEVSGVHVHRTKVIAFMISTACAGIAGSLYAHLVMYIDPKAFTTDLSTSVLGMVVLGGMGNQVGVLVSSFVLTILPEVLRGFDRYRMLLYGVLLVVAMLLQTVHFQKTAAWELLERLLHRNQKNSTDAPAKRK